MPPIFIWGAGEPVPTSGFMSQTSMPGTRRCFCPQEPFTCVIAVVVGIGHASQAAVRFVDLCARMVAELSSGVRIALPGFYAFPPPWLVFIIRVILFVLDPEPLSFFHKGTFLIFA